MARPLNFKRNLIHRNLCGRYKKPPVRSLQALKGFKYIDSVKSTRYDLLNRHRRILAARRKRTKKRYLLGAM